MRSTKTACMLTNIIRRSLPVLGAGALLLLARPSFGDELIQRPLFKPAELVGSAELPSTSANFKDSAQILNDSKANQVAPAPPSVDYDLDQKTVVKHDQLDPSDIDSIWIAEIPQANGISVYDNTAWPVVDRVIAKSKHGQLFFTPKFGGSSLSMASLCLDPALVQLTANIGQMQGDGTLRTGNIDPLAAAVDGVQITATVPGTQLSKTVSFKPVFSSLTSLSFAPPATPASPDGKNGEYGRNGANGLMGQPGRPGSDRNSATGATGGKGGNGANGGNGMNGTAGRNGGDGKDGNTGKDCNDIDIKVSPIKSSQWYSDPLVKLTITQGNTTLCRVVEWGQKLQIDARGAAGGNAGSGGRGGDGGNGGNGGAGGIGGMGGRGAQGTPGQRGSRGSNGGMNQQASAGEQGGPGNAGGDGGSGGNGGHGGRAGDGAAAGDGGNGGKGGDGGTGGHIAVKIEGPDAFVDMVKGALALNIDGGDPGKGGLAGDAGKPGDAGTPGNGGAEGLGGYGGAGGLGGAGGPGGTGGFAYTPATQIPGTNFTMPPISIPYPDAAAGLDGDKGPDGGRGPSGNAGDVGQDGKAGPDNPKAGKPGEPGSKGGSGSVQFNVVPTDR